MRHFTDGSKIASARGDTYYNMVFLSNMAVVSSIRKDTSGIKYALEIYDFGKARKDTASICSGAYLSAMFYSMKDELEKAYGMLDQAIALTPEKDPRYCEMLNLQAEILHKRGEPDKAEKHYILALEHAGSPNISASAATSIYLSYGKFLIDEKRFSEAIGILKKGTAISEDSDNRVHKYRFYQSLSQAYESLGQYSTALSYHKQFSEESENAINIEKERAINDLTRKYEEEKYEREIQQHNIEINKKKRALTIAVVFSIVAAGFSTVILSLYRKKNRLYTQIVKQYRDEFRKRARNSSHSGTSDEEIFQKVEKLIKDDGKYSDNSLTRDRIAEMIGTNRTYLSRVINEKTGMSFANYLNSYRIEKALELLSDPEDDTPLKAIGPSVGFSSMSTFYKLFQEKTGMTPTRYRRKIIEISKNGNLTKTV